MERTLRASLVALGLAGCGAGEEQPAPSRLEATVQGCDNATVHDSGQVVYVIVSASCSNSSPRTLTIGFTNNGQLEQTASARLTLSAGDESVPIDIPTLGLRRVGLFQSGQWRTFANTGSWAARDGAGLLVLHGELYLLGGWLNGPVSNEVWKSSDVEHWQFLGHAPWPARHGAGWLVHDHRLWVVGGDLYTDVWSSPDGVHWTEETPVAPFGPRYTPNAASLNGEIVVYAGQDWVPEPWCHARPDCQARADRSVWKSRNGKAWYRATPEAPWEGRALIHGSVVHHGEIYLIGGGLKVAPRNERYAETSVEFRDIWSSSDGINWRRRAELLPFPARTHFSVVATPHGCFVSDGSVGTQSNLTNDIFVATDCIDFKPVTTPANLGNRHASSIAYFNGSLVVLGGPDYGGAGTAVWQYFP